MLAVHVPAGVSIQQVDDFPPTLPTGATEDVVVRGKKIQREVQREFKRSIVGAIHVRPRSTLHLTDDEYAWLKDHHKALYVRLQKLSMPKPKSLGAKSVTESVLANSDAKKSSGKKGAVSQGKAGSVG